jgi:hypothetical protein
MFRTCCKFMMLCGVVLGNIKKVEGTESRAEGFGRDPLVDPVLGQTNFREFVVYDAAQIYSEYIMWYRPVVPSSPPPEPPAEAPAEAPAECP